MENIKQIDPPVAAIGHPEITRFYSLTDFTGRCLAPDGKWYETEGLLKRKDFDKWVARVRKHVEEQLGNARTENIIIRVTPNEKAKMQDHADRAGLLSLSAYIRAAALKKLH